MSHRLPLPPPQEEDFPKTSNDGMLWLHQVRSLSIDIRVETFTYDPASLGANTHTEETVTVTGLNTNDIILSVIKPTFTQGFHVGQARVSAANTLAIQIVNGTGSASDPGSETYTLVYIKNTSK